MKNQTTKKIDAFVIIVAFFMVIVLSSCSSGNEEYSQELQNQVSALQTQNALLQENLTSQGNREEAPKPPSGQEPGAELILQTPTPESLPTEPVPAGQPIVYDGWSMMVSKEINLDEDHDIWGINVYLMNLNETNRIFRFTNSAITAKDNLGNVYEPSPIIYAFHGHYYCEEYYHQTKNLEIKGLERIYISAWAVPNACKDDAGIGMFLGPIPLDAEYLIIHFDGFGPFTNVDVVIDL